MATVIDLTTSSNNMIDDPRTRQQQQPSTISQQQRAAYSPTPFVPHIWDGSLLLTVNADPSQSFTSIPLSLLIRLHAIGGSPLLSFPLPTLIEDKLRISLDSIQSYVQQVIQTQSKKVTMVSVDVTGIRLNDAYRTHTNIDETALMHQTYSSILAFCHDKNRGLAFDYQRETEKSSRFLMYLIPPRSLAFSGGWLRSLLGCEPPTNKMWGLILTDLDYNKVIRQKQQQQQLMTQQPMRPTDPRIQPNTIAANSNNYQAHTSNVNTSIPPSYTPPISNQSVPLLPFLNTDPNTLKNVSAMLNSYMTPTASVQQPAQQTATSNPYHAHTQQTHPTSYSSSAAAYPYAAASNTSAAYAASLQNPPPLEPAYPTATYNNIVTPPPTAVVPTAISAPQPIPSAIQQPYGLHMQAQPQTQPLYPGYSTASAAPVAAPYGQQYSAPGAATPTSVYSARSLVTTASSLSTSAYLLEQQQQELIRKKQELEELERELERRRLKSEIDRLDREKEETKQLLAKQMEAEKEQEKRRLIEYAQRQAQILTAQQQQQQQQLQQQWNQTPIQQQPEVSRGTGSWSHPPVAPPTAVSDSWRVNQADIDTAAVASRDRDRYQRESEHERLRREREREAWIEAERRKERDRDRERMAQRERELALHREREQRDQREKERDRERERERDRERERERSFQRQRERERESEREQDKIRLEKEREHERAASGLRPEVMSLLAKGITPTQISQLTGTALGRTPTQNGQNAPHRGPRQTIGPWHTTVVNTPPQPQQQQQQQTINEPPLFFEDRHGNTTSTSTTPSTLQSSKVSNSSDMGSDQREKKNRGRDVSSETNDSNKKIRSSETSSTTNTPKNTNNTTTNDSHSSSVELPSPSWPDSKLNSSSLFKVDKSRHPCFFKFYSRGNSCNKGNQCEFSHNIADKIRHEQEQERKKQNNNNNPQTNKQQNKLSSPIHQTQDGGSPRVASVTDKTRADIESNHHDDDRRYHGNISDVVMDSSTNDVRNDKHRELEEGEIADPSRSPSPTSIDVLADVREDIGEAKEAHGETERRLIEIPIGDRVESDDTGAIISPQNDSNHVVRTGDISDVPPLEPVEALAEGNAETELATRNGSSERVIVLTVDSSLGTANDVPDVDKRPNSSETVDASPLSASPAEEAGLTGKESGVAVLHDSPGLVGDLDW